MSTRHVTSQRSGSAGAVDIRSRRPAFRGTEVYGSETLPVLVQLPDLTRASVEPGTASATNDEQAADERLLNALQSESSDVAGDTLLAGTVAAATAAPLRGEAKTVTRSPLQMRRKMQQQQADGWLPGLRRFLVAVVIAAILFTVIITIKEWNQAPAKPTSQTTMSLETDNVEFGPPELNAPAVTPYDSHPALLRPDSEPALGSDTTLRPIDPREGSPVTTTGEQTADAPSITPPSSSAFGSFGSMPVRETAAAVPGDVAGMADGVAPASTATSGYPNTGFGGVSGPAMPPGPVEPGRAVPGAWPANAGPPQPVWNAERAPHNGQSSHR
jgi:hypothetical protein